MGLKASETICEWGSSPGDVLLRQVDRAMMMTDAYLVVSDLSEGANSLKIPTGIQANVECMGDVMYNLKCVID